MGRCTRNVPLLFSFISPCCFVVKAAAVVVVVVVVVVGGGGGGGGGADGCILLNTLVDVCQC